MRGLMGVAQSFRLLHFLRKNSKLASIWKDVKHCTEVSSYPICCQLLKWLMLWEEEVAKKREETEDLQKKLQEASAMQAGFLPFFAFYCLWCPQTVKLVLYLQQVSKNRWV